MPIVSAALMGKTWQSVAASSPKEILRLQKQCGKTQEELTGFVIGFTSDCSEDAVGLAMWIHLVVMQAFLRSRMKLKRIAPARIERTWRENEGLFNSALSGPISDPYTVLVQSETSEPAVLRYIAEALTEDDPDDPIDITDAERLHLMRILKTVTDCLHEAARK
jgi:hypothetical protein